MATLPQYTDTSVYLPNYTPPKISSSGAAQVKAKPVVTTPQPVAQSNITPIPTSSGQAVNGLASFSGGLTPAPFGGKTLNPGPGLPAQWGQNMATTPTYHQDAGQYMTDEQYTAWKNKQPIDALKATTGVQTDAQKGLMSQQAQIEAEAAAKQNAAATAQAEAERAFASQMAATQQGYGTQNAATQQGYTIAQMEEEARLRQEAAAHQMAAFPQILSMLDAQGASGPTSMGMSPQEEEARRLAFTHAREMTGNNALASLRALGNFAAQNGQTGSSMERQMQGGVIGGAAHDVNDFIGEQAIADVNRAAGIADRDFAGNLTRRGQNLSVASNFLSGLRY